jgi:hypothetical protein
MFSPIRRVVLSAWFLHSLELGTRDASEGRERIDRYSVGFSDFSRFILLAVAAVCAAPALSYAQGALPPPICDPACNSPLVGGTSNLSGFDQITELASYTVSPMAAINGGVVDVPTGLVSASGFFDGIGAEAPRATGVADLTYYYEVVPVTPGPLSLTPVPLNLNFTLSTSATADPGQNSVVSASVEFPFQTGPVSACSGSNPLECSFPSSLNLSTTIDGIPFVLYDITLIAGGDAGSASPPGFASVSGTASWSASIDPQLLIDPSFQYAADYALEVSPGPISESAPQSAVPEPTTLTVFGTALASLALLRRRKKAA